MLRAVIQTFATASVLRIKGTQLKPVFITLKEVCIRSIVLTTKALILMYNLDVE